MKVKFLRRRVNGKHLKRFKSETSALIQISLPFTNSLVDDCLSFLSPKAALLFVSPKNRDLWAGPTPEVRDARTFGQFWQTCLADNTKRKPAQAQRKRSRFLVLTKWSATVTGSIRPWFSFVPLVERMSSAPPLGRCSCRRNHKVTSWTLKLGVANLHMMLPGSGWSFG